MRKHQHIFEVLSQEIASGKYRSGQRLPSESQLVKRFNVSRPTAQRALLDLVQMGLVERHVGSGTYVTQQPEGKRECWGMIVPGLKKTEFFEPICTEIARLAQAQGAILLWGELSHEDLEERSRQAEQLCRKYVANGVTGLFFAPLEFSEAKDRINRMVIQIVREANIPTILLDRDIHVYPERSDLDLVGIDNFASGWCLARHMVEQGCRTIAMVARPYSAPTVDARIAGIHSSLSWLGFPPKKGWLHFGEPEQVSFVRSLLKKTAPDAIICANDLTAAALMRSLYELGVQVPKDIRIAGFDDIRIASLLPVPLTTIRQPCKAIGACAVEALLGRQRNPDLPSRQILLNTELVVRQSTQHPAPSTCE